MLGRPATSDGGGDGSKMSAGKRPRLECCNLGAGEERPKGSDAGGGVGSTGVVALWAGRAMIAGLSSIDGVDMSVGRHSSCTAGTMV